MEAKLPYAASINEHSSIRLAAENLPVLYFDPFHIKEETHDADIIMVSHDHFDHYSPEDIALIAKEGTQFVAPRSTAQLMIEQGYAQDAIHVLNPGEETIIGGITIHAVAAYNPGKKFHPKENHWIGFQVDYAAAVTYVAGDTDVTPELMQALVSSDVAFLPVGGTYTMTAPEAAAAVHEAVAQVNARLSACIPTHYGDVAGSPADGQAFAEAVSDSVAAMILI